MERVNCNLCGSSDHRRVYSIPDVRYFVDEWFDVVECTRCGLGFVNPRPTVSEMPRHYPPAFFQSFKADQSHHARRYDAEAKLLTSIVPDSNRVLLDLGCANGDFPRFMRNLGWRVEGLEISSTAEPISDFKVYRNEFSDIPIDGPYYDVITAWAVLEHVHDPMAYFKKAAQVLKRGGIFVFLVTNFESHSSRHLYLEDVPRHLFFFTERAVKEYLKHSGFALLEAQFSDNIYSMHPVNFLRYYLSRILRKRPLEWSDTIMVRPHASGRRRLQDRFVNGIKLSICNPLSIIEYALMPIYEAYQILSRTYGIVTYVAERE